MLTLQNLSRMCLKLDKAYLIIMRKNPIEIRIPSYRYAKGNFDGLINLQPKHLHLRWTPRFIAGSKTKLTLKAIDLVWHPRVVPHISKFGDASKSPVGNTASHTGDAFASSKCGIYDTAGTQWYFNMVQFSLEYISSFFVH